eukprot:CFRG1410T1
MTPILEKSAKINQIEDVIKRTPVDVDRLRRLAANDHGLVNSDVRAKAWPILLGFKRGGPLAVSREKSTNTYTEQIMLDIRRSYGQYPPDIGDEERKHLQDELDIILNTIMCRNRHLHYYQGYHDVCAIVQQVVSEEDSVRCCERLSMFHLRNFLQPTMDQAMSFLAGLLPLLSIADPELYDFIEESGLAELPHFALSWVLTWFSHSIPDIDVVGRIFDVCLAYPHPLLIIYLCATYIIHRRDEILATECEFSVVFKVTSHVTDEVATSDVIAHALRLYDAYAPHTIMRMSEASLTKLVNWDPTAWPWLNSSAMQCGEWIAQYTETLTPISRHQATVNIRTALAKKKAKPAIAKTVQMFGMVLDGMQAERAKILRNSLQWKYKVGLATVTAALAAVVMASNKIINL